MSAKKDVYIEYFVNHSFLKRFYFGHLHRTKFDKFLDYFIVFAVIFSLFSLVLELFGVHFSPEIMLTIHLLSLIVLFIFVLELVRAYAHSKSKKHFFKKHWLDILLVGFLSLYFLSATYFGVARLLGLEALKGPIQEMKHLRVIFSFFFGE